jgi:glyceraldehyde 3-phosphate dehydrogenase
MTMDGNLVKVLALYDNEWAYACRIAELVALLCERGLDAEEAEEPALAEATA